MIRRHHRPDRRDVQARPVHLSSKPPTKGFLHIRTVAAQITKRRPARDDQQQEQQLVSETAGMIGSTAFSTVHFPTAASGHPSDSVWVHHFTLSEFDPVPLPRRLPPQKLSELLILNLIRRNQRENFQYQIECPSFLSNTRATFSTTPLIISNQCQK